MLEEGISDLRDAHHFLRQTEGPFQDVKEDRARGRMDGMAPAADDPSEKDLRIGEMQISLCNLSKISI